MTTQQGECTCGAVRFGSANHLPDCWLMTGEGGGSNGTPNPSVRETQVITSGDVAVVNLGGQRPTGAREINPTVSAGGGGPTVDLVMGLPQPYLSAEPKYMQDGTEIVNETFHTSYFIGRFQELRSFDSQFGTGYAADFAVIYPRSVTEQGGSIRNMDEESVSLMCGKYLQAVFNDPAAPQKGEIVGVGPAPNKGRMKVFSVQVMSAEQVSAFLTQRGG